jgi:hypothetical protein
MRSAISLCVAINLLVCPYLCSGVALFGAEACYADCGDGSRRGPQPTDPCDRSGTSCLCTGATCDNSTGKNLDRIMHDATDQPVCESTYLFSDHVRAVMGAPTDDVLPSAKSGPTLRAWLQSWLI